MTTPPTEQPTPPEETTPAGEPAEPEPQAPGESVPTEPPEGTEQSEEASLAEARYFAIQDSGDPAPWALVMIRERGIYERWTGEEEGWVDMPFFASYFVGGEVGAVEIERAEAEALKAQVKPMRPGVIAMYRGDGEGIPEAPVADDAAAPPADGEEEPEPAEGEGEEEPEEEPETGDKPPFPPKPNDEEKS